MKKIFCLIFLLFLAAGFRVFPNGNSWPVDTSNPKLWLVICPEMTALTWSSNDLPANDPIYNQTVNFNQVIDSIANDFVNVPNSFIQIGNSATDGTYNTTIAAQRSINICLGSTPGASGGYATLRTESGRTVGCDIKMSATRASKLKWFVSTLTHEIGHCLGFDHSQDTTHAIMSYFHDDETNRLQIDDKMGLIYMYPENANQAKESMTFGLSCSPRN
ncbi:MAG: hypothetical protein A4S09_06160 [Proteobacteria bacterium SG_bin7]|nr:MAG: hypothetical protein A4S09_06160 [Proteobacteria bacterium SG_bin7]